MEKAIDITNRINPQLVFLTGDFIQETVTGMPFVLSNKLGPHWARWSEYRRRVRGRAQALSSIIGRLAPQDGLFAVFGNHEHMEGLGSVKRMLPSHISWLKNTSVFIRRGEHSLFLGGIDDVKRGKPDLVSTLAALSGDNGHHENTSRSAVFRLLLSHNPDVVCMDQTGLLANVDLILSGHTHGGQVRLPFFGPVVTRTRQRQHVRGLSMHEKTAVYVTSGVGYGTVRLRLLCPPEISVFTLRCTNHGS